MHLKKTDFIVILIIVLLSATIGKAQVYLNPFTQQGLGDMSQPTQVNRLGMGGTSYTETDPNRYNFANPASYALVNYFSFEMGASGNLYNYKNADLSFKNLDVRVPYLSIAFPIDSTKKWGLSVGLMPYSRVGYDLQADTTINGIHKTLYQTGSGGLTRFYAGTAIRAFKNFYVGANIGYIFGTTNSTQTQSFPDTTTMYGVHQTTSNTTSGFLFDAGFVYDVHFKLAYKRDKALNDSFTELYNQELNQKRSVKIPVSPKNGLDRIYLRLSIAYEKSRDSLQAIKISKEEQKTKLAQLKESYSTQKANAKNSIPKDSFDAYHARMKSYDQTLKDIEAKYQEKKKTLEKLKKAGYEDGLKNCTIAKKHCKDSIRTKIAQDTTHKYTDKEIKNLNESCDKLCYDYLGKRNYTLQFGGTVNLPNYLPTSQSINAYTFSNNLALSDSLSNFTNSNNAIYIPFGAGASVELRCENNWKIGVTGEYRQWSKFINTTGKENLNDYYSLAIGGQWTPQRRKLNNTVFTEANYKFGLKYSQTPYVMNGNPVNDMRLSLGLGLPIAQNTRAANPKAEFGPKNWPYVDLALELGQTGSLSTNKIQQQYVMLSLGIHIFELNWFQKRKLE